MIILKLNNRSKTTKNWWIKSAEDKVKETSGSRCHNKYDPMLHRHAHYLIY